MTRHKGFIFGKACLIMYSFLCAHMGGTAVSAAKIKVVLSQNAAPYEQALEGFKVHLLKRLPGLTFEVLSLEKGTAGAVQASQDLQTTHANLNFALGSLATEALVASGDSTPIVAGLVLKNDSFPEASNVTGVFLEFPVQIQFEWIKRLIPQCKTIGVLYNPEENQKRIDVANQVAQKMSLRLEVRRIDVPRDLPAALRTLAKEVDILWGIPDRTVFTPQTAKNILLFSFRNRIPFTGPSETWVKAGALYALCWDYADLGAQCGEMAYEILQGSGIKPIQNTWPRKVMYCINLKTARHMKIELPEELVEGAKEVY